MVDGGMDLGNMMGSLGSLATPENLAAVENLNKDLGNQDDEKKESVQIIEERMNYGTLPLDSDDLKQRAYQAVMNRFNAVKSQHENLVTFCDKWEQMWKVGTVDKKKDTVANIGSMDVWNYVEDWTAAIMDAVFGVIPPITVRGKRKKLPNLTKDKIVKVLWNDAKASRIDEECEIGIREGVKLGTFTFKTPYEFNDEPKLIVKSKPKTYNLLGMNIPMPGQFEQYVETEIEVDDRPALRWVDIRKLYFRYDKLTWVIEEINSTWSDIEKQARDNNMYANIEKAKEIGYPSGQESDQNLKERNKVVNSPNSAANIQNLDGDVMLYEAHHIPITFKETDDVPDELKGKKVLCIVTIANQKEVIRIQPTPFRKPPYIITPMFRQPGSVLGIGVAQIIEYLVTEYNTRKNQSLDANTFGLYCMVVANMRYIKKRDQLKIRQNGLIELKDLPAGVGVNDVISFVRPPVEYAQIATAMVKDLQDEMARTVRLKNVLSGEKLTPNTTATETVSIVRESLKSVRIILNRIDRNIFQEYFNRAYIMSVLNRQKSWVIEMEAQAPVKDQMGMPVIDPATNMPVMKREVEWEEVTPEQIYSDGIDIEMLGTAHMQDELILQHKIMQAMDLSTKFVPGPVMNEEGQWVIFNTYKGFNDILYSLNIQDIKDYWKPVPPPMPMGMPGMPGMPEESEGLPGMPAGGPAGPAGASKPMIKAPAAPNMASGVRPSSLPNIIKGAQGVGL